jgi:hypothetical protein
VPTNNIVEANFTPKGRLYGATPLCVQGEKYQFIIA